MFRSPKNLRSKGKSNSQPTSSVNQGRTLNKRKSLNETFEITNDVNNEAQNNSEPVPIINDKFFDKKELEKLSTNDKISLVVDKAIDVINSFNTMKENVLKYEKAIEKLMCENSILTNENTLIRKKLDDLEIKLKEKETSYVNNEEMLEKCDHLKQQLKNDECEIWGVNEVQEEDLLSVVVDIAKKFNTVVSTNDINFISRKNSGLSKKQNAPRVIRVKFYNRLIRDKLIKEGRSLRIPKSNTVNQENGHEFIYINEALTRRNEFLYGKARELKRKKVIEGTWCKQGRVFVQRGNLPPKLVGKIEDLNDF